MVVFLLKKMSQKLKIQQDSYKLQLSISKNPTKIQAESEKIWKNLKTWPNFASAGAKCPKPSGCRATRRRAAAAVAETSEPETGAQERSSTAMSWKPNPRISVGEKPFFISTNWNQTNHKSDWKPKVLCSKYWEIEWLIWFRVLRSTSWHFIWSTFSQKDTVTPLTSPYDQVVAPAAAGRGQNGSRFVPHDVAGVRSRPQVGIEMHLGRYSMLFQVIPCYFMRTPWYDICWAHSRMVSASSASLWPVRAQWCKGVS